MKKTYSAPTLVDIRLACTSFLVISGGGKGSEGDDADSAKEAISELVNHKFFEEN